MTGAELVMATYNLLLYAVNLTDTMLNGIGDEFITKKLFCYHATKITEPKVGVKDSFTLVFYDITINRIAEYGRQKGHTNKV